MKIYVTYRWRLMNGNKSELKAVECSTKEQAQETALDLCSIVGIMNVRINYCGRLRKGTTIVKFENYKSSVKALF